MQSLIDYNFLSHPEHQQADIHVDQKKQNPQRQSCRR